MSWRIRAGSISKMYFLSTLVVILGPCDIFRQLGADLGERDNASWRPTKFQGPRRMRSRTIIHVMT
jgi:hypothetical protein